MDRKIEMVKANTKSDQAQGAIAANEVLPKGAEMVIVRATPRTSCALLMVPLEAAVARTPSDGSTPRLKKSRAFVLFIVSK